MKNKKISNSFCTVIIDYLPPSKHPKNVLTQHLEDSFNHIVKIAQQLSIPYFIWSYSHSQNTHNPFKSAQDLLNISNKTQDFENILFLHSNMPLTDINLTKNIIEQHLQNLADYTFYEFVPVGLTAFALHKDTLKKIAILSQEIEDPTYSPTYINEFIHKDANNYDIEILLLEDDLRFIKENLFITDQRSSNIIKKIEQNVPDIALLGKKLKENPSIIKDLPQFFDISLTNNSHSQTIYDPPTEEGSYHLNTDVVKHLLKEITSQEYSPTIQFSNRLGEPFLYKSIIEILSLIKSYRHLDFIIETDGILLEKYLENIIAIPNLNIIIHLSASSENMYTNIHNNNYFNTIEKNTENLLNNNYKNTYIQYTRMQDNEEEIKMFMDRWQSFKEHIIISQYNDFCQVLKNRKVINLAPLKRFPCFKLQREFYLNYKGNITLCLQDIQSPKTLEFSFGLNDSLTDIYTKLDSFYNLQKDFNQIPSLCNKCDYWYIFNF